MNEVRRLPIHPDAPPAATRRRHVHAAPHLRIPFGQRLADGQPVFWDSKAAINGHMLLSGPSGTGKTYQLNAMLAALARQGVPRIHVLNVHGDLCDGLPEHQVHTVRFSEQSPYGLQPLELLDDADIGGVRRRCLAFINLMARQGALGQRQRPALFRLLSEGYRNFGFHMDDPKTWTLNHDPRGRPGLVKRYPTLKDLKSSIWTRLVMLRMGQTQTAAAALDKVITLAKRRSRLRKQRQASGDGDVEKLEAALEKARVEAREAFAEGLERIDTGEELEELILWNNPDCVQSLFDRIEALELSGVFKSSPLPFPRDVCVYDYNIQALDLREQQLFTDCLMERLYVGAKQRGECDSPVEFVVIDEADGFTTDDPEHIINRMVKELRKFGVGMILAGQSFEHFSDDLLMSASVKLVLGCPEMFLEPTRRRLGLAMAEQDGRKVNPLSTIRPRQTAFAGVAMAGENRPIAEIRLGAPA